METKLETASINQETEFIKKNGYKISKTQKCLRHYIRKTKKKTIDLNSAIQSTYDYIDVCYNMKKEEYYSPSKTEEDKIKITNELLYKYRELNKKQKYTYSLISSVVISVFISVSFSLLDNSTSVDGSLYWENVIGLCKSIIAMFDNVPPIVSVLMLPIVLLLFCFAMLVPFGIIIATYLIAETLYYSKYRNMVVPYEKEVLHKILTDIDERYSNLD